MIRLVFSAALTACAAAPERALFSVDALLADAPAYIAARYRPNEPPAVLIAELTADEFQCQHSATTSECGRSRHAFGSCFDVVTVGIASNAVQAEQSRRCMGAQQ